MADNVTVRPTKGDWEQGVAIEWTRDSANLLNRKRGDPSQQSVAIQPGFLNKGLRLVPRDVKALLVIGPLGLSRWKR